MQKTILLVDDKKLLRDTLIDYLGNDRFRFLEAETGEIAIDIFREKSNEVDVVLLDENLPGINGIKTLRLMKKINEKVPVIALTGELTIDIRKSFIDAGAYDVQAKSAIYEKLIPSLEGALEGKAPSTGSEESDIDFEKMAEALKNDGRWEESALYLREAGMEQKMLGNVEKAAEYFEESITRYKRAGRTTKAKEVEKLLDEIS
ncbi:MAG: two-component system, OmpR family, copper resistance phosphate regulon response regulator CusR [Candidatus Marinimicrobia bacterium]|jgi:DNA-binding NtrC family response regulator|nr:two-component system, OmpR family, copper resistance phosphate regulon response regulator CusR [Candidatus Neomarinimicrobiota bacterium]